jgi:hypothetical protein
MVPSREATRGTRGAQSVTPGLLAGPHPGRGHPHGPVGFLVDAVVQVLRYDPATCVPEATRPGGYLTARFQALGASWLLIDWNAIRLPTGITAPR